MIFLKNQGRREREVGSEATAAFSQRFRESSTVFFCTACGNLQSVKMSSIPMGAHAAFKVRDSLFFGAGGGGKQQQSSSSFQQQQVPTGDNEMQPAKYNGKLMNSIWGMYNRYSVHNIKSHIAYDKA